MPMPAEAFNLRADRYYLASASTVCWTCQKPITVWCFMLPGTSRV